MHKRITVQPSGVQTNGDTDGHRAGASRLSQRRAAASWHRPGRKIEIDLLPNGKAALTAARSAGSIHALAGWLKHKTNGAVLSIDELNDAISSAANRATTAE